MYIEPNGDVYLLHTGLPSDYTDSITFPNVNAQVSWMVGKQIAHLTAQSYTRVNAGVFRCSLPMSTTYNVDYMMFQNLGYENKWFFAFVNKIDYINNGLCQISFTIDVIQTWFIATGMSLGQCFVSREIVADDNTDQYLQPEPFALGGEYVMEHGSSKIICDNYMKQVIVMAIADDTLNGGHVIGNTYNGCALLAYSMSETSDIIARIKYYTDAGKPDAIVGLWMCPLVGIPGHEIPDGHLLVGATTTGVDETEPTANYSNNPGFNGWYPKNNKLYTYPYNFCRVTTGQGNKADYRYEFFDNNTPRFEIFGCCNYPASTACLPRGYKGNPTDPTVNQYPMNEGLSISSYPMCSWSYDSYAAWLAQNSVPMANERQAWEEHAQYKMQSGAYKAFSTAMKDLSDNAQGAFDAQSAGIGALTAMSRSIISGISSAQQTKLAIADSKVDLVTDQMNAQYTASLMADTMGGSIVNGSLAQSNNQMYYSFSRWHLNEDRLKTIDDYFSMFGYTINKVKTPDITSRPQWNYVKTVDANIRGNMPSDDRNAIKAIFDNGIRFWHNGNNIGNYSLANK